MTALVPLWSKPLWVVLGLNGTGLSGDSSGSATNPAPATTPGGVFVCGNVARGRRLPAHSVTGDLGIRLLWLIQRGCSHTRKSLGR